MTADGKTYGDGKEEKGGNAASGLGGVTLVDTCGVALLRGRTTFTQLTALTRHDNWAQWLYHFTQQNKYAQQQLFFTSVRFHCKLALARPAY